MIQVRHERPPSDGDETSFSRGELVRHRRYGYRGVVVDYDLACGASEAWYASNRTQPRRNQPWYHVLVDGAAHSTYAAEENLVADELPLPVEHPLVELYFSGFAKGYYVRNDRPWDFGGP